MKKFMIGRQYRALKDNYFGNEKIVFKGGNYKAITYNTLLVGDSEFFMPEMKDFDSSFELVSYQEIAKDIIDELSYKKEVIDNLKDTTPSYAKGSVPTMENPPKSPKPIESKDSDFTKAFVNAKQLNEKMAELINESYANLHDMPWSESKPKKDISDSHQIVESWVNIESDLQDKYNQHRKEYDSLVDIYANSVSRYNKLQKDNISDKRGFSFSIIELENTIKELRSEIEDYKKTIKSFESDRKEVKNDPYFKTLKLIVLLFIIFTILESVIKTFKII